MKNVYINKDKTRIQLKELLEENFEQQASYTPDTFKEKQNKAYEILKLSLFFEEVMEESIAFNKKVNWEDSEERLKLVENAEEMIEVFKLRSKVYTEVGYQNSFPDPIEGLNFDRFDKNSAIVCSKTNNVISGTLRIIFDTEEKLPTDTIFSHDDIRKTQKLVGVSRNIVSNDSGALSLDFKYLMKGIYNVYKNNDIDMVVAEIKKEHYRQCSRFGGMEILCETNSHSSLNVPFLIIKWDMNQISPFFKKVILK
jgi:N-acyl-L-homoserine lactone synthetase